MSIIKMAPDEFRRMQLIELDLLKELDRVCRENDIRYCIAFGTLLGAVRHNGYIPWDDDADVVMLREDYEKFKRIASEGKLDSGICFFQDHSTDVDYLWGYGKLRRVGTSYIRDGQEHLKGKTGAFIDIFPLDDVPKSIVGQIIQDKICWALRKILWSRVACISGNGIWKYIYKVISIIPIELAYRIAKTYIGESSNKTTNPVRTLLFPAFGTLYRHHSLGKRFGMPKTWFLERKEYDFEGNKLWGIAAADEFLTYIYGNYMELPPEEKRIPHAPVSYYDFGDLHLNDDDVLQ